MEKSEKDNQDRLLAAAFWLIERFNKFEACGDCQPEAEQAMSELSQAVAQVKEFLRTSGPARDVES